MEMNIKELGRPFEIEDDDNIKKAEALSKDLDDVRSASSLFLVLPFFLLAGVVSFQIL